MSLSASRRGAEIDPTWWALVVRTSNDVRVAHGQRGGPRTERHEVC